MFERFLRRFRIYREKRKIVKLLRQESISASIILCEDLRLRLVVFVVALDIDGSILDSFLLKI